MVKRDRHKRITIVPFQRPGVPESVGLSFAECEQAAWAIAADGTRFRGAAAINAALSSAIGIGLPLFVYRLPLVRPLQDWLYTIVARNRHRLPGVTPHCSEFPADCVE